LKEQRRPHARGGMQVTVRARTRVSEKESQKKKGEMVPGKSIDRTQKLRTCGNSHGE